MSSAAATWQLRHETGEKIEVTPRARMIADETLVLLGAAAAGLGMACLPEDYCAGHIERGQLVRVLSGWTAGEVITTILVPHRRGQIPAVSAVIESLAAP